MGAVKQARARDVMTVQSNEELLTWEAPDGSGGSVAQLGRWTRKDKTTGEELQFSNLLIANVQIRDGKKVLVEMTEVMK